MKRAVISFALALGSLAGAPALAQTPEPTLTAALQDKTAVGKARLRYWGFDVYDAKLWARPSFAPAQYVRHPFALELQYLRGLKGEAIAQRSLDELHRAEEEISA